MPRALVLSRSADLRSTIFAEGCLRSAACSHLLSCVRVSFNTPILFPAGQDIKTSGAAGRRARDARGAPQKVFFSGQNTHVCASKTPRGARQYVSHVFQVKLEKGCFCKARRDSGLPTGRWRQLGIEPCRHPRLFPANVPNYQDIHRQFTHC